jgi:hypothetical protein
MIACIQALDSLDDLDLDTGTFNGRSAVAVGKRALQNFGR